MNLGSPFAANVNQYFDLSKLLPINWERQDQITRSELSDFTGRSGKPTFPFLTKATTVVDDAQVQATTPHQLTLVSADNYSRIHMVPGKVENRADSFPRTMKFVRELPFKFLGRVVIWDGTDTETPSHIDLPEERNPVVYGRGHFILFDLGRANDFWVQDQNQQLVFPYSPAVFFNSSMPHGALKSRGYSYYLRVDGKFEDSFYKRLFE